MKELLNKKFIFYNPFSFKKYFKIFKNIDFFPDEILNLRDNICKIDSTNNMNFNFIKNIYPFKKQKINKSFLDLCFERIDKIIKNDKPIRIYWSGGIDSSLIILLFIYKNYFKEVEILLTNKSIEDFKYFFQKYIKDNFKYTIFEYELDKYYIDSYLNIVGDGIEELCGWNGKLNYHCILKHDYSYHHKKIKELNENDVFDLYWKNLYEYGLKTKIFNFCDDIETIEDLSICLIINLHWQYAKLRFPIPFYDNLQNILSSHFPFYATEDFRNWALQNKDKLNGDNYFYDSKKIIKESIYYFDKNLKNYIQYKPRGTNISYKKYIPKGYLGYDDNYKLIKIPQMFKKFLDLSLDEERLYYDYEQIMLGD